MQGDGKGHIEGLMERSSRKQGERERLEPAQSAQVAVKGGYARRENAAGTEFWIVARVATLEAFHRSAKMALIDCKVRRAYIRCKDESSQQDEVRQDQKRASLVVAPLCERQTPLVSIVTVVRSGKLHVQHSPTRCRCTTKGRRRTGSRSRPNVGRRGCGK